MSGFVKLYGELLTSSVWLEDDATLRVWIGLLVLADADGYVGASVGGLAHACRVSRENCAIALDKFMSPDEDSRTPDNEGKRIERADGGWRVLNARKYRDLRSPKQVADAERIRQKREQGEYDSRGPLPATDATSATRSNVAPEVEVEVEVKERDTTTTSPPPARDLQAISQTFAKPAHALAMLKGMTEGLGTGGMKPVPVDVLLEASDEIAASGGDVTPHRFKAFVRKILERGNPPPEKQFPPRARNGQSSNGQPSTRESRSHAALESWLAKKETTDAEVVPDGEH